MSKVEWLCSRCADLESKQTETDPVLLRLCTSCKVENYVRPFGHAGEDAFASEEEVEAAKAKASEEAKVMRAARERVIEAKKEEATKEIEEAKSGVNYTSEVAESIPSSEEPSEETIEEKVEDIIEEAVEEIIEVVEEAKPYEKMTKAELLAELGKHGSK